MQASRGFLTGTSQEFACGKAFPSFAPSRRRVKACDMSNDPTRQHLLGTWKLIAAVREEISSGTKTEFLGPNPVGYINYGADGRMLVLTVAGGRPPQRSKRCFAA
jgi:hypothetical protein